jgi:pimeloyl-CoA synthetase
VKNLILILIFVTSLTTTFAQSTNYQFIYYKIGTDAKPIYYFSDLFTSTDWYNSKEEIKSKFKSLLAEEGVEANTLLIQEGLKGGKFS